MLTLVTLGGLALRNGSVAVNPSSLRKPLALLTVVATGGENGVGRERLQSWFWPERDTNRARGGLKQALYVLRGALGVDPFIARGTHITIDRNVLVADCTAFELATRQGRDAEAVHLYGGPFLDGVYLKDLPEFDHWVDEQRARLAGLCGMSLERLGRAALDAGDARSAVEWWRQRTELDRLDERVTSQYVAALVAAGDRLGALRHLRVHAELMRGELDAEPSIELQALAQRLIAAPASAASADSMGTVEDVRTPALTADVVTLEAPAIVAAETRSVSSPHRLLRRGWIASRSALLVIGCVVLVIVLRSRGSMPIERASASTTGTPSLPLQADAVPLSLSDRAETTAPGPAIGRVLIVPLSNMSHDSTRRLFRRLAAFVMLSALTQTGLVDVVDAQTTASLEQSNVAAADGDEAAVRALAARAGANTVVVGRYYTGSDSLFVQVIIESADDGRVLRALPVIGVPATKQQVALARLRDRIAGAFATLADPRISSLVDRSTPAPSLAAFRAYAEGLDCYISLQGGETTRCDAARSFAEATRADSTWTLPYVWLMDVDLTAGRTASVDSLLAVLEPRRLRLSELDRYSVEYFRSTRAEDGEGVLRAARHAAACAPRSDWVYKAALAAQQLGRPRESLALLRRYDPEHGWVKGWLPYVILLLSNEHRLARYADELRDVEIAERTHPGNLLYATYRLRALAGLRDSTSMLRIIDSIIATAPSPRARSPIGLPGLLATAQSEAVAHFDRTTVNQIGERCLRITEPEVFGSAEARGDAHLRALCLYNLARWSDSKRVAEKLSDFAPAGSQREQFLAEELLARVDAHLGDSAASFGHMGRALSHSFSANRLVDSLTMLARIASIRGDKAGAVRHLGQLPIQRLSMLYSLHTSTDFAPLAGYPPFVSLLRDRERSAFGTGQR